MDWRGRDGLAVDGHLLHGVEVVVVGRVKHAVVANRHHRLSQVRLNRDHI